MTYDISLYDRAYLQQAIENQSGDWRDAPTLPEGASESLLALVLAEGFTESPHDPGFIAFSKAQGIDLGAEYAVNTPTHLAQLTIFPNSLAFTIPFSDRASQSIELCAGIAKKIARLFALGYYDPQSEDDIFQN